MIFLTGPHGAGKTAVAKMVARYNFDYVDLGGILREVHQRQNPEISFHPGAVREKRLTVAFLQIT